VSGRNFSIKSLTDEFVSSLTNVEASAYQLHVTHLRVLLREGTLALAGPTHGHHNTDVAVYDAADE